jgi:hypothetical protein
MQLLALGDASQMETGRKMSAETATAGGMTDAETVEIAEREG